MFPVRFLGLAVAGGVLLELVLALPGTLGGPGEAGLARPSHVPPAPAAILAESDAVLPPNVVLAAFSSNLAVATGRPLLAREPGAAVASQSAPQPDRLEPFEIAALLGQELPSLFQTNLTQPIQRALTPPSFSVAPEALNLTASVGAATTLYRLRIDSLGGTVNWRAGARTLSGTEWLSILPDRGTATTNLSSVIGVEVNYVALGTTPGLYQGVIDVRDADTGYYLPVPVVVALLSQQSRIALSDSSVVLNVAGGGLPSPPQTIQILNRGIGNLDWFIPVGALQPWLNLSSLNGTAGSDPSQASNLTLSINNTAAQAMASGVYQALLPISSNGASNSPEYLVVTLQRVPRATPALGAIKPTGLYFVAQQGSTTTPGKDVTVFNRGGGSITVRFEVTTESGGNWLSVTPTSGDTSAGPFTVQAFARPGSLTPGRYRGRIRATFSAGNPLDVEVVLVVQPPPPAAWPFRAPTPVPLAGCTPASMDLIANTIGNGASVPISFPKVLVVTLVDSCGEFVSDATVVGSAEGSAIPMQALGNGTYSGTWVPAGAGSVTVSFAALHPTLPSVNQSFTVSAATATEGIQLPVLFTNGVVENAGFTPRRPLAPGSVVALFGSRLGPEQRVFASRIPLERELAGVKVRMGNTDVPLYDVQQNQIDAQVPVELEPGSSVSIVVNANGRFTAPQTYLVSPAEPGVVVSGGRAVALVNGALVSEQNPAHAGDVLEIYSFGLGKTDPPVSTGTAGFASNVLSPVSATIGGVAAEILFQGLNSCCVGLYQVNLRIAPDTPTGDAVPITFFQNGVESNTIVPAPIVIR